MRPERRAAALLALAAFAAYVANARLHLTSDGTPHLLTAASWLLRGDADLNEYLGRVVFSGRFIGEHFYSYYPPGTPLLLAAPLAASLAAGADPTDQAFLAVFEKVFGAVTAAASVALVYLACRRLAGSRAALAATLAYAFATGTWSVSGQELSMHAPSQLFVALGAYLLVRDDHWAARSGLALGVATLARPTDVVVVAFGALASARRGRGELARYVAWGLPALAFLLVYDALVFGSPLRQSYPDQPWFASADGYLGLLLSPSRGLLVYSPVLSLSLVGIALAWARRGSANAASLVRDASVAIVGVWLVYGSFGYWWGGWSYGNRYLLDVLPLFAMAMAYAVACGALVARWARVAFAAAFGWSAVLQFAGASYYYQLWDGRHWDVTPNIDATPWRLWDWTDPQWAFVLRHLVGSPDATLVSAAIGCALAAFLIWRVARPPAPAEAAA